MKYTDFVQEIEKDPEYAQAKEALKINFALGNTVLRARIARGWTQSELAERVGTKQANISRIEAGQSNPTLNLIQKILLVLEIEVAFTSTILPTQNETVKYFVTPISSQI